MSVNFETIYAALFALAQHAITGVVTYDRTLKAWDQVPAANQPALFQVEKDYQADQGYALPPKWTLHAEWYLYVNGSALDQPASAYLNNLLTQVATVIPPKDTTQVQTLGGLVFRAWISGKIETDEGVLGQQRVAVVPIEILAV